MRLEGCGMGDAMHARCSQGVRNDGTEAQGVVAGSRWGVLAVLRDRCRNGASEPGEGVSNAFMHRCMVIGAASKSMSRRMPRPGLRYLQSWHLDIPFEVNSRRSLAVQSDLSAGVKGNASARQSRSQRYSCHAQTGFHRWSRPARRSTGRAGVDGES